MTTMESARMWSGRAVAAFFLFNANYICTIAFYKNIMITSFYEWRDVSFLYGRLVCIGSGALVFVFGSINTYFVSNDFIIAIIFSLLYALQITLQFGCHCIHSRHIVASESAENKFFLQNEMNFCKKYGIHRKSSLFSSDWAMCRTS